MLSTRLGQRLPAFLAAAFALTFCDAVNGFDFFLGLGFSQTGLLATVRLLLMVAFTGLDSGLLCLNTIDSWRVRKIWQADY
jgi:hypothetical protein